jgi:hypothetical protein
MSSFSDFIYGDEVPETPTTAKAEPEQPAEEPEQETEPESTEPPAEEAVTSESTKDPLDEEYELKVYGKTSKYPLRKVLSMAQKAEAAEERFRKAAELERRLEDLENGIRNNLGEVARKYGHDVDRLAEDHLRRQIEQNTLSPQERALREAELAKQRAEQQLQGYENQRKEQEFQAEVERLRDDYHRQITEAMKESTLPKTELSVARVASRLGQASLSGYDMPAHEAVDLAMEDYASDFKDLTHTLNDDGLVRFLGPEIVKRVIKADLGARRTAAKPVSATDTGSPAGNGKSSSRKLDRPALFKKNPRLMQDYLHGIVDDDDIERELRG